MTREELKEHCEKQIENCEMWARCKGEEPHGKVYEEHKLILKLLEQEPKKGHWIKTPKAVMGEGYMWYCDKCKHKVYQDSSRDYPSEKFCPSCGSDNREVWK